MAIDGGHSDFGGGRPKGSTLMELSVVIVVTGILASMAIPSFSRSIEQARVDQAAAILRTIWASQRLYRLDHDTFASSLAELASEDVDLISAELAALEGDGVGTSGPPRFEFWISEASSTSFKASARRLPAGRWSGTLTIDENGMFDSVSFVSDGVFHIHPAIFLTPSS